MDFFSLADHTNPLRIHRYLDEILGENDDEYASTVPPASGAPNDGGSSSSPYDSYSSPDASVSRPFLSPASEDELYLLATNFLLYVAMVIITTLVAKIYFPETLERVVRPTGITRSFSYRVADEEKSTEDYYGSDAEEDEEEVLDSEDEQENLLREPKSSSARAAATAPSFRRQASNFLEFQQESLSRSQVLKRLIFCSIMLNLTFVLWGALQERMLTRRYPRYTGDYFTYSYALVFTNRFWTLVMSTALMFYLKPRRSQSTVIYEYSFPAISNMLSSWCQYEALRYVSFPATTLFKSFKLAPVMMMGKILGNKTYPQYDYVVALMIGAGICMFMTSTDDLDFGQDVYGMRVNTAWTGVMLLFLFLFFDSFTSQFQSRMFQRHRDLSMIELMFAMSAYSTVLSFITLVHTNELYPSLQFVMQHSEIHLHFFLFSICSTIGQVLIYYCIKNFGAVVFTLIMTLRILLSIALSCVMYGHKVTSTGFFGLLLVMAAVLYRIKRKAQGTQLLKWQGMDDESGKTHELVQEWHEHVDM